MKKVLIVRFSSIGDIVLTTPVIRAIKTQLGKKVEVHFLTKSTFLPLLKSNPYIHQIHCINNDIDEVLHTLKAENFDFMVDLHHNLRTSRLKSKLKIPAKSFPKLNLKKWLLTQFKINRMPHIHIVDRYFEAVKPLGVVNDGKGLDYFIPKKDEITLSDFQIPEKFIAFAIGAQFATKRLPTKSIISLINKTNAPVVLLGGPTDIEVAEEIINECSNAINLCGKININQSASVVKQAQKLITHDTGLMHIAAAFNQSIISIWGNTVPEFGMYPYEPEKPSYSIHQVEGLSCRPCSKIGYQKCPKGHFNCMQKQDLNQIAEQINQI